MDAEKINKERLLIFKISCILCKIASLFLISLLFIWSYFIFKNASSQKFVGALYDANFLKHLLFQIFITGVIAWIAEANAQRANRQIKEIKEKLIKP